MWNQKSTLELIEDIRLNPCLWNLQCEDFKSRGKKNAALKSLGVKYGVNCKEIESKFHALKNQFRREHRRIEKQEEGLSPKQIHWFGYEPLLYLLNNCVKPSISREEDGQDTQDAIGTSEDQYTEYIEYETLEPDYTEIPPPRKVQRLIKAHNSKAGVTTATEAFKCMRTLAENVCSRDAFDIYGEYIAHKLRDSGRTNKEIAIAQHEINNICFKLCMGEFANIAESYEQSLQGSMHSNPQSPIQNVEIKYVQYEDGMLK